MSVDHRHAASHFERLLRERNADQYLDRLAPKPGEAAASFPAGARLSTDVLEHRWEFLAASPENKAALLDPQTLAQLDRYGNNIENFVGTVKVPVGIAGPLRVNGLFAQGDYLVPLATTEAALVASYHRGAQLLTAAGGCTSVLLSEGVSRAPGFAFRDLRESGLFVLWVTEHLADLTAAAERTTRHGKLADLRVTV